MLTRDELRLAWTDVLSDLEARHRTAWRALFDGRIADVEPGSPPTVHLDFQDAEKFASVHGYERHRRPDFLDELARSITHVTGVDVSLVVDDVSL